MISPNRRQLYGFALALVLGQRVVQAQAALTFEQLTGILKANDRVVVTADTGQNTKGRVVAAAAQESAASFDALAGRIQVGQRIWVTDTAGRESSGRVERLSSDGLVLKANGVETFTASEIRRVRAREHDSLKNGTLIGLGMGGGMGTVWCIAANADDSGDIDAGVECAEGFIVFPGLGVLIGLALDAMIPGKRRVVYQASPAQQGSRLEVTVVPLSSSRAKGLSVSFVF